MIIEELNLNQDMLKGVNDLGFTELTPIQEKCIPEIREGKDVVGQSSTGSGKTFAFGLPILEKIEHGKGIQSLILTPTRELCVQDTDSINSFAKYTHIKATSVYGGVGIEPQIHAIKRTDIVVGTPGRIIDHINRGTISFENVKVLVLDEADKMFEMGFLEDVEFIISNVPKKRQTLLFSATIPHEVHKIVEKHLHSPVFIKTQTHVAKHLLKQFYCDIRSDEKFSLLVHLLKKNKGLSIVFCSTRRESEIVGRNLQLHGVKSMTIHGGLTQNRRSDAIDALKNGSINVLVATDVAARGLDIKNVSHIYNYDVPKTSDEYIHRIGRTARAGEEGSAITLLGNRDHDNFRSILRDRTIEIEKMEKPQFEFVEFSRYQRFENGRYSRDSRMSQSPGRSFGRRPAGHNRRR